MAKFTIWGIIFIITLSEVVINTQLFIHGNSHGYIPANNEVRYIVDELPLHKEFSSGGAVRISNFEEDVYVSSPHLRLNPRVLDFKDRHLGVPHHEKVTVFNTNDNKTIQLTSISGNTVHFHSSFFEDKVIPPLGNTSFSVVFLGREEGTIESTLFIHTSEGSIKYPVKGNSISSPYRLRPLIGVHMPMNASFAPLIRMHNPHPNTIQIVEIFSSGGELSLELPSGELEAAKNLWEIQPFETKAVIRARLLAQSHRNHTCYVRIRVNGSDEHLVIPLEVEVGSAAGLYPPDPSLDLGVLGSEYPPTRLSLRLHNSGKKSTLIQNVFTVPVSKAIQIDFQSIKVPPDSNVPTEVAVITFNPKAAFEEKHFSGKIVVKGKNRLVIPYHARVLKGGLKFNASISSFCTDQAPMNLKPRNFSVRNTFLNALVVGNITVSQEAEKYFKIRRFKPQVIPPGGEVVLFEIVPNISSLTKNFHLESYIQIVTNVSIVTVPLLCYDGHVVKVVPPRDQGEDEDTLDLGLMGVGGQRDVEFGLINPNPVEIALESWGLESHGDQMVKVWVELLGVGSGARKQVLERWEKTSSNLTQTMSLQSHHYAVFRVGVTATSIEGYATIEVFVKTKYEKLVLPIKIHIAKGSINVDPGSLVFTNCFPGKVSKLPLEVKSTFQKNMKFTSLTNLHADSCLLFPKPKTKVIKPFASTTVGDVHYDPRITCKDHCYLGIDLKAPVGQQWLKDMQLPNGVWEHDATLLSTMYMWFLSSIASPRTWFNYTMRMDTTQVRGYKVSVATRLVWPALVTIVPHKHIVFPLSQVGNTSTTSVEILNPADTPLIVQIAMGALYAPGHSALGALPVMLHPPLREAREAGPGEFSMQGIKLGKGDEKLFLDKGDNVDQVLNTVSHDRSISLLLKPGANYTLYVHFTPRTADHITTLLFIRNNLTVLEVLRLSGQGAQAHFKFGNRKPGSPTPLQFDLSEKHLRDCNRKENKGKKHMVPMLTVRRSFTARNTGELPIYVSNFLINDLPCEGFGFKVLNCKPFLLTANSSRKIEIAFSPDFTLARVQRLLKILTSLGPGENGAVNYSLVATLPISLLNPCGQALPRPPWESTCYYFIMIFMALVFTCTVAAALIESDRIHKCSLIVAVATANGLIPRTNTSTSSTTARGPSVSSISSTLSQSNATQQQPQQQNQPQQIHQPHIPQNKNETTERNKRELNISTNNNANRTQVEHNNLNHNNNIKEKSNSPEDSPDDDNNKHQENNHNNNHRQHRNSTSSASPQSNTSNARNGTKKKLSKKHSAGNSDSCDSHSNSQINESWNPSPSPSPSNQQQQQQQQQQANNKSQLDTNSRKTVWSGVFVRSNGKPNGPSPNKSSVNLEQEEPKFALETKETPSSSSSTSSNKRVPCNQGKNNRKNRQSTSICEPIVIVGVEEDNSSTTTESSNNEEMDKDAHAGTNCKPGREARDSYEGDGEEEDEEPRLCRGGSKSGKQTKASLEQTTEVTTVSLSQTPSNKQVNNTFTSSRQQQAQTQESHKTRQAKQNIREKNTLRTQAPTKRKPQQERPIFRVLPESEPIISKPACVVNWEPPPPAPTQENTDSGPSPLLYSKIVAPVPETPPPAPAVSLSASPTEGIRKKEAPGPIGPKPPPKRIVPSLPQCTNNWDFPSEPRMGYTSGINAAPGAIGGNALDTPSSLLDMFTEPPNTSLLADSGGWDQPQSASVMKFLQEERRRRVEQHQQKLYRESWPRFEQWDSPPPLYCPAVQASANAQYSVPSPTVESTPTETLWDGGQQTQMWNTTPWLATPPPPINQQHEPMVQQPPQPDSPLQMSPQFDLFGSVTHLWDLPHPSGNTWNQGEPRS